MGVSGWQPGPRHRVLLSYLLLLRERGDYFADVAQRKAAEAALSNGNRLF